MSSPHYGREYDFLNVNLSSFLAWMMDTIWHCMGIKNFYSVKYFMISAAVSSVYFFFYIGPKVIIEKSRGEVSPMGQDTIENVS